jgi:hypothetical protein
MEPFLSDDGNSNSNTMLYGMGIKHAFGIHVSSNGLKAERETHFLLLLKGLLLPLYKDMLG